MKTSLIAALLGALSLSATAFAFASEPAGISESTDTAKITAVEQRAEELKARAEKSEQVSDAAHPKDEKPVVRKRVVKLSYDATKPMANEQPSPVKYLTR